MKGLSPEEFNQVSLNAIQSSVRDPALKDLIQNEGKTLTPDEVKSISEKIRAYGK
jgi:predicted component of type VI protein secretion system